ncbi:GNAT family N-acetyltransferase [Halomonas desiderata]|jgi:ribosomal-protein-alanine N-acetyltransferase|uniref:GNAT family N-acetyltransferase n=1 Tax=Billgrantia aerodenitrificans TaxID=2733483 RepID=A0ABS9AN68_9GAMM|nr:MULTISPECIES: GNAT family N-acetyltransferase [Halomonas]MCE8023270.1 GNAT family N-acetyltransferase [Halomonas aerodenitrificans]MCE8040114.1 GNAT family N-acetyltransferase [Halomonas sp. MCCC 1A11062]NIC36473.1 GNAT family N-acetyltransferase [Halomonas desiderata]
MFELETPRLRLRPLATADVPALADMLADPEVMRHSLHGVCDEAATRLFLDWCFDCYIQHRTGPLAMVSGESDEFVGFCGVSPEQVKGTTEWNLGYRLARPYWGQGLATEAAVAALDHAFEERRFDSIIVLVEPDHAASLRVAEKVGFSRFDTLSFNHQPVRLYRMRRSQWQHKCSASRAEAELPAILSK